MRILSGLIFLSIDGVMQAPKLPDEDTSGGFKRGAWAEPWWEEVMTEMGNVISDDVDVMFGRRTYDLFAAHQPGEGTAMAEARKYVVTSNPANLGWKNSTAISGDLNTEIRQLKSEPGNRIQIHGSSQLMRSLIELDLVDEFRLWTFPVLLGEGKRLFPSTGLDRPLNLIESAETPGGVKMSIYRTKPGP